jgi:hypothetical protein
LSALLASGCGEDTVSGNGDLGVYLAAEESISEGLGAGTGEEEASEDYAVTFEKYLVAIGSVQVAQENGANAVSDETVFVADMRAVGENGLEIAKFNDLSAGQWPEFGFSTVIPGASATALAGTSAEDLAFMVERGITYWIEGTVQRPEKPVRFVLQVPVNSRNQDCALDGNPGVVVMNGPSSATVTLHGDHIFFNAFPSGAEGVVRRRAGWIVEADTDDDGLVTSEDLAKIDASTLFTSDKGYSLSLPFPNFPIVTALDYVRAQLATQGHLNGEGGCIQEFTP